MRREIFFIGIIVVAGVAALWAVSLTDFSRSASPGGLPPGRACTMEALLCPDGSYVGRTGPNCEFTPCPPTTATSTGGVITPADSGVRGTVSLGPTCPVMRDPPDPACADKGYATTVVARRAGSNAIVATRQSSATGAFEFSLPPGSYTLSAGDSAMLPRCSPTTVTVGPSGYTLADISCDTGIR